MVDLGDERALFSISVASELTAVNPQMLRVYEHKGLLAPYRTDGGTRRYSGRDIHRIGEITTLLAAGLNLAGIEQVLELRSEIHRLKEELHRLRGRASRPAEESAPGTAEPKSERSS